MSKLDQPKMASRSAKKRPQSPKIDTAATGEKALSVLDREPSEKLKRLKIVLDETKGQQTIIALENLLVAAIQEDSLNQGTLINLGFTPEVSTVLIDLMNGRASLADLDKVWKPKSKSVRR